MCSGSEAGSYLRLIDFVYHSTLGLRVIKKKELRGKAQRGTAPRGTNVQGYVAHKKQPPPRTARSDYVEGHMVALGRGGVSYERGTPVLRGGADVT